MTERANWYNFQEAICKYFQSIGADAQTNVLVHGVRTSHNIDVIVKTKFLGEALTWIIEAKLWNSRVNKLQVLGLRTIVDDIGADRAFIISEKGFQKGAYEAAENTNVKLRTFEELKISARELVETEIVKTYIKRLELLEIRYWSHSKSIRKKYGLRGEIWEFPINFSGYHLLMTAQRALISAERREFPIILETFQTEKVGDLVAENFQQLTNWLNLNFNFLDQKILEAEASMIKNGDFNPDIDLREHGIESPLTILRKVWSEVE